MAVPRVLSDVPMSRQSREELQKRSRYDIYAEIIRVISIYGHCPLTRAARSTNLPVDRAKESIGHLVERGLLEEDDDEGRKVYKVTVRGHQYLELYRRIASLVGMPMPEPIIGM
ncbi:MAG: winged helix-turn-helix domain-containing protein [Candidatus Thorarchaeota archaeon]